MQIISTAFANNTKIPSKYTCDGENVSPPLEFIDVPESSKSLALIVDDPDAPMGTASNAAGAFVHWVLFNINPLEKEIPENSAPQGGIEGMTDFGKPGYGGPCPPSGVHRYFFKLYALDTALELQNADKQIVEEKMQSHILAKAEIIGLCSKKQ